MSLSVRGDQDLVRLSRALREAGDGELKKRTAKALREAAKPLAPKVLRDGATSLPARGGLRERVMKQRPGITTTLTANNQYVAVRLRHVRGLEAGRLRHPVFGNRKNWVTQAVKPHGFSKAFDQHAHEVVPALERAVAATLNEIARRV